MLQGSHDVDFTVAGADQEDRNRRLKPAADVVGHIYAIDFGKAPVRDQGVDAVSLQSDGQGWKVLDLAASASRERSAPIGRTVEQREVRAPNESLIQGTGGGRVERTGVSKPGSDQRDERQSRQT
jgi:hypothetical protein